MGLRDKIAATIPWIEPVLDYFDWRKRVVAIAAGIAIAGWSFVKDLPWPVIVVLGFGMAVFTAYALVFPAFIRLLNVGVQPRPNFEIWKHKAQFQLIQAAYLLADREPNSNPAALSGDPAAWYEVLFEAIQTKKLAHIKSPYDDRHTDTFGKFSPETYTLIEGAALKTFCAAKGRHPEFLS
jgi:hypothetical protein